MSAATILRGSGANVVRLTCTSVVAVALPLFLTRRLVADEYGAWVTLLQISTYVALLDIGLQVVVARFVAEHHARSDGRNAVRVVAAAVRILLVGALVGIVGVVAAASNVAALFPEMPAGLRGPSSIALLLVGFSSAVALPFGPFLAAFTGLQQYGFPVVLAIVSKSVSAVAVVVAASLGGGLLGMAVVFAAVNLVTLLAQYVGWVRLVRPRLSAEPARVDVGTVRLLLSTGGLIALWSIGGLLVNGLDTVIVGHFDFGAVGAFAVATTAVNFLLLFLNSLFSPLMPAAAGLHGPDAPERLRGLTLRGTRYSTLLIVGLGSVLCVLAHPLLAVWVGPAYADTGAPLLRLLVLGHSVRQLAYVYSLVVVARGQQRPATVATMSEALVNVAVSVALAQSLGAAGVAIGTIVGAAVSVVLHLTVSMRFTRDAIPITRAEFLARGIALPALTAAPLLLLVPSFDGATMVPANPLALLLAFAGLVTAALRIGLHREERQRILALGRRLRRSGRGPAAAH